MAPCVLLLRVSGVAQLSRSDSEVNDDGEGDDIGVELLPVQLVDTHRAWFLQEYKRHTHRHMHVKRPKPTSWRGRRQDCNSRSATEWISDRKSGANLSDALIRGE